MKVNMKVTLPIIGWDHCNIKFCLLVVKVSIKLIEVCNANKITTKVQTVIMTKRKIEKYIETYIDMFQLW